MQVYRRAEAAGGRKSAKARSRGRLSTGGAARALWGFLKAARLRKPEAWRLQIPTPLKRFGTIDAKEGI